MSAAEQTTQRTDYSAAGYKRSRAAYIAHCNFDNMVATLVSGAFFAKLMRSLGMSDSLIGIISAFSSLAFIFQIFSIVLTRKNVNTKAIVTVFNTLGKVLLIFLYVIPFLPLGTTTVKLAAMACILFSYSSQSLVSNICFCWASTYVDPESRSSFSSLNQRISLICGIAFSAVVGYVFDRFEKTEHMRGAFLFIAVLATVLAALGCASLLLMKPEQPNFLAKRSPKKMKDVLLNTLFNKQFLPVILLSVLWSMAENFSVIFVAAYATGNLMISVFTMQIISILGSLARILVGQPFGKYSDKTSYAHGTKIGLAVAAAAFAVNCFTTPKTWYLVIVHTILYGVCLAGIKQNSDNIAYSYVKYEYISEALSVKSCIGGICGFASSLVAGKLLSTVQQNGNLVCGITVYGQQLLSAVSLLLVVAAFLLTHFVIEKQQIRRQ